MPEDDEKGYRRERFLRILRFKRLQGKKELALLHRKAFTSWLDQPFDNARQSCLFRNLSCQPYPDWVEEEDWDAEYN